MKYKAILLVLASEDPIVTHRVTEADRPLYPFLKRVWEAYMNSHPDYRVFFTYSREINDPKPWDIVTDVEDGYGLPKLVRTVDAMKYINANYEYEYLIRTNLSTFWDLSKLGTRLDGLPKKDLLTGTYFVNVNTRAKENPEHRYAGGYDMIISRDVVSRLVANVQLMDLQSAIRQTYMNIEDEGLCIAINTLTGVPVTDTGENAKAFMFANIKNEDQHRAQLELYRQTELDHFRARSRAGQRAWDKESHVRLLRDLYGIQLT